MVTAFFFCLRVKVSLGEGHERYYQKVEVSSCYLSHTASIAESESYLSNFFPVLPPVEWHKFLREAFSMNITSSQVLCRILISII